jgi:hypothetical protein
MSEETDKGYVYILTNDAFKEDWVKIGMTSREPDMRAADLDNTAVPVPYNVFATVKTSEYKQLERAIHRTIDRISDLRIRPNREFFNISPEEAYGIFEDLATLIPDAELKKYNVIENTTEELIIESPKHNRSRTEFSKLGINVGDILYLKEDQTKTCKVVDGKNKIEYIGDIYVVSAWCGELLNNGVNGFEHICKAGETRTLWDRRL